MQQIVSLLDSGGNLNSIADSMRSLVNTQLSSINQVTQDAVTALTNLDQYQTDFTQFLFSGYLQSNVDNIVQAFMQSDGVTLDTGGAAMYLVSALSSLTGNSDLAKFGTQMITIGEAAENIATTVGNFIQSADEIANAVEDIGSLGASLLTGNFIGAALDIFGMFGGGGGSSDADVLNGINQIQQQLTQLSKQMNDRFDRVDEKLNNIYNALSTGFNQMYLLISNVQTSLAQINSQLASMRSALFTLQSSLDRLQTNMYYLVSATVRPELYSYLNGALDWIGNNPKGSVMPFDTFSNYYYNFFYTWATSNAYLPTEELPANVHGFTDQNLLTDLNYPLETNVDYLLNQYIQYANQSLQANLPTLTTVQQLANPRDWEICAEAIMNLFADFPTDYKLLYHAPGWSPQYRLFPQGTIWAVDRVGRDLQSAIANITLVNQSANYPLFNFLRDKHTNNLTTILSDIATEERNFAVGKTIGQYTVQTPVDPWYPWSDVYNYQLKYPYWYEVTPQYVGQSWGIYNGGAVPQQVVNMIPYEYKFMEMLGMGHIQVYLDVNDGVDSSGNHWFQMIWLAQFEGGSQYSPGSGWGDYHCNPNPIYTIFDRGSEIETGGWVDPNSYWQNNMSTLMQMMATNPYYWYNYFLPGDPYIPDSPWSDYGEACDAQWKVLQESAIEDVVGAFGQSGPIANDGMALNGSKMLYTDYVALGLSRSLESSDLLRSLLYGNQSIPNTAYLINMYDQSAQELSNSSGPLYWGPRDQISWDGNNRINDLSNFINQRLSQIQQTQITEPQRLLDTTLKRLVSYERIAENVLLQPHGLSLSARTAPGGSLVTGTVTLTFPADSSGGAVISLTSNDPTIQLPATVTILPGASSQTFAIQTSQVDASKTVNVTAQYDGSSTATLTLTPDKLAGIRIAPASVVAGVSATGTVTLVQNAPASGILVALSSSDARVGVPANVLVPAGVNGATFPVVTANVLTTTKVTISAEAGGVTHTATLTVRPVPLARLTLSASSVIAGTSPTGTVTLASPAPSGDVSVALSSSDPGVVVPSNVTVPAGSLSATFSMDTLSVLTSTQVTINAQAGGVTKSATLTIKPIPLKKLGVSPGTVYGGQSTTGTVTLTVPAPSNGAVVTLSSSDTNVTVPISVTVPAGSATATFPISTLGVSANETGTITASAGGVAKSVKITLKPAVFSALTLSSSSVRGGNNVTGKVALAGVALTDTTVNLLSANPKATVPVSVVIPAGQSSATFTITTVKPGASAVSGKIFATAGGILKSQNLTVTP